MTALAKARTIVQTNPDNFSVVGVETNVIVFHGAMISKADDASTYAYPSLAQTGDVVIGIADLTENVNTPATGQAPVTPDTGRSKLDMTSVAAGSKAIQVRTGVFERENKGGDLVTNKHIGLPVYVEDDNTVRATGAGTSIAGTLMRFHPKTGKPMVMIGTAGRGV